MRNVWLLILLKGILTLNAIIGTLGSVLILFARENKPSAPLQPQMKLESAKEEPKQFCSKYLEQLYFPMALMVMNALSTTLSQTQMVRLQQLLLIYH
jgi:hypothetical protein